MSDESSRELIDSVSESLSTIDERRKQIDRYVLRNVHPNARFGTASDRYAGWIGQIYPESYLDLVQSRSRRLGGQKFEERTVPIESVRDYFEHFDVLELDFTFYRPLVEDGKATTNFFVLQQYAEHAPDRARFLLKAPQPFFARRFRRSRGGKVSYEDNPTFLDVDAYIAGFLEPARDLLGDRLEGVLFEQEYQRKSDGPDPVDNVVELDGFFSRIGSEVQNHIEIRSAHLLVPAYFDWLRHREIGFVFSHWTWLPPLREQWRLCGEQFTAADRNVVARLLTPLKMPYEKAYAQAHPFDRPVPEIANSRSARDMILDVTALIYRAEQMGFVVNVINNNRAYGNAPELGRNIAHRVLDEEEKREGRSRTND